MSTITLRFIQFCTAIMVLISSGFAAATGMHIVNGTQLQASMLGGMTFVLFGCTCVLLYNCCDYVQRVDGKWYKRHAPYTTYKRVHWTQR